MGIPFKFWLPGSYHNRAKQLISALIEDEDEESDPKLVETAVN